MAVTVAQLRLVVTGLLAGRKLAEIVAEINAIARRNEEARIYHWQRTTGRLPPRRSKPDP